MDIPCVYGLDLFRWGTLNKCLFTEQEWTVLQKLLFLNLLQFNSKSFSSEERDIIGRMGWGMCDNAELKARALDVLRHFEKDKREYTIGSSNAYLQVFDETLNADYLWRAILVRNFKQVLSGDFYESIRGRLVTIAPPMLQMCIEMLINSYRDKRQDMASMVLEQMDLATHGHRFRDVQTCLDILNLLKVWNDDEINYRRALCYEHEADEAEANCDSKTFIMPTHIHYTSAYKAIYPIREKYLKDYERIRQKMLKANQDYVDIVQQVGAKIEYRATESVVKSVDSYCEDLAVNNVYEFVGHLIQLPFMSSNDVEKLMDILRSGSIISALCGSTSMGGEHGNEVGRRDSDEALRTEAHKHIRANIYYAVYRLIQCTLKANIDTSESIWVDYLSQCKPDYVTNTTIVLLAKGLSAALDDNIVLASHILMPALERFLREFAEDRHGLLIHYEKERQEDANIAQVLTAIEHDFDNPEEFFEIQSFLTNGIDVNMRNRIAHGLMRSKDIMRWGVYLVWIVIKLYFKNAEWRNDDMSRN